MVSSCAAAQMTAIAVAPTRQLRLTPNSAFRYRSLYRKPIFNPLPNLPTSLPNAIPEVPRRQCLCTVIAGEAVETTKQDVVPYWKGQLGGKVGEFRKKLKVVGVKSGPHEGLDFLGQTLVVKGWVRTLRVQSSVTFVDVEKGLVTTGASVWVQGVVRSQGSKQKVELKLKKIMLVGKSDPSFPIQKKRVSGEFLRTNAHLHPRTNTFGVVARVRNALAYATHKFFQENGFVWVSSPVITASDCEGAGEQFCVTILIPNSQESADSPVDAIPQINNRIIDWYQDFFGKPAFLTVSGQLNGEAYATALTDVHRSILLVPHSERRILTLPGTWLNFGYVLDNCKEDMDFLNTCPWIEKGIIDRLSDVADKEFAQITCTEAIDLLLGANEKFEFPASTPCFLVFAIPHAGFGLGFERLVQFATGMDNVRDVIPFPRTPGSAEF